MPAAIDVDGPGTLVDVFEANTARYAGRVAPICFSVTLSDAELGAMARAFAAWLQGRGVAKGDGVAI